MRALVFNAGSATLKAKLFECSAPSRESLHSLAQVHVSGIGSGGETRFRAQGAVEREWTLPDRGLKGVAEEVLTTLWQGGVAEGLDAVGHRVVHGGTERDPAIIDDPLLERLAAMGELAPLHNGPALAVVQAVREALPGPAPMVAVFDTAFHASMPEYAAAYAIPRELVSRHGIRRYGFHGLAHRWMSLRCAEVMGRELTSVKLVTLQLGSGCSACAVLHGRSVDTSMGMTPLEGLMMRTRSGNLDPSIVAYLAEREGVSAATAVAWLNERSGLLGVAGMEGRMDRIIDARREGDEAARLAFDMFCYRIKEYLGAYMGVLGGADAVVFGGGIGEASPEVRQAVCGGMEWSGLILDRRRNEAAQGAEARISADGSRTEAWVLPVDEEVLIALDTVRLVAKQRGLL